VEGGLIYHVHNRGSGRMNLFHKDGDYQAFVRVLAAGLERYPVDLLMGNHGHLLLCPHTATALGRLMDWVG